MSDDAKCPVVLDSGYSRHERLCGKPVKRDGMCGVHAAGKERRAVSYAKWEAEIRASRRAGEELDRQCLRLRSLGVQCTTDGKGIYLTDPESMIGALTAYRTAAEEGQ